MMTDASIAPLMRRPDDVLRLDRMGTFHSTRLSFTRVLVRRLASEGWQIRRSRWDLDDKGFGVAVYEARGPEHTYSLIAYSNDLDPARRTDRVIAEEWDATFTLFDGVPGDDDIERLKSEVPRQEAGRCSARELVLSRANKSVRLFDTVVDCLASGRQPDAGMIAATGYLMRTTAVYGNGKFGIADRARIAERPEFRGPFQAEMLTVYLIRAFTHDLVEHVARARSPERFVPLDPRLKRDLGIGNSTGLGMAPFLNRHPVLIDRWMKARETALARVRALESTDPRTAERFAGLLARARRHVDGWTVPDERQAARIAGLARDLGRLASHLETGDADPARTARPWDRLYRWAARELDPEAVEMLVSLMLEPHGSLVDDLADTMHAREVMTVDPDMPVGELSGLLAQNYDWALRLDFDDPREQAQFWYVSEEKLEPRLGWRFEEPGGDLESPLATARDAAKLAKALSARPGDETTGAFLARHPEHRHTVRRVQLSRDHAYGEIRDNLVAETCLAIDLLRCKLSFFGASRFDPKSDRWTRITLFQGAPLPDELAGGDADDWLFPVTLSQDGDAHAHVA